MINHNVNLDFADIDPLTYYLFGAFQKISNKQVLDCSLFCSQAVLIC